MKRLFKRLD